MSRKPAAAQPSSIYVFVVLSLAVFFVLFTFFREPGVAYDVRVTFRGAEQPAGIDLPGLRDELRDPELVLEAMEIAGIISYDLAPGSHEEAISVAQHVADRLRVYSQEQNHQWQLALKTERPQSGAKLLDCILSDFVTQRGEALTVVRPATIVGQRGGSISADDVTAMVFVSCFIGGFGILLGRASRPSAVLSTPDEVVDVVQLPVVADLAVPLLSPTSRRVLGRRRVNRIILRVAEVAVAAVFLLILFNFVSNDDFAHRFVVDPFAAYGEALTSVIG